MPMSRTQLASLLVTALAAGPALAQFPFGSGTTGSGGISPRISCNQPWAGRGNFAIAIDDALGGTVGLLVLGFAPDNSTYAGLPVYVSIPSVFATRFLVLGGSSGVAGAGSVATALPLTTVSSAFVGLDLFAQATVLDPAGPGFGGGWAATGGLALEVTAAPQLFASTSVGGSTDPYWAVNGITGAIDHSGGNQYTDNVDGVAYTNDGHDLYLSSGFGKLAHADVSSGLPVWSWLNSSIGTTGVAWDNCVIDRQAQLLWMMGRANGVVELLAIDIDAGSPTYGGVVHSTTTLSSTIGLIGVFGMSHDHRTAAVPSLLGGSLYLVDTDPTSPTFLQITSSAPIPTNPTSPLVLSVRIRFNADDTECYVLQQNAGQTPGEIARFLVPAGIWFDHDPATAVIDNIGPTSNPPVPFGSAPLGLDIGDDGAIYVSGWGGAGWAGRVTLSGVAPTWTPLNAISSLANARHVALNRDQDVLAVAVANPTTSVLFFDVATLNETGATTLSGSSDTTNLVWR